VTADLTTTNTQLFRPSDAADPAALGQLSPERSDLVRKLTSRRRIGHLALDNDLAGEETTRLVPPPVVKPEKVGPLGSLLTALRKRWS
jgi:hypothetical protein